MARILNRDLAALRAQLTREIREPKCAVCRELRDELVNARVVALELFDRLQERHGK